MNDCFVILFSRSLQGKRGERDGGMLQQNRFLEYRQLAEWRRENMNPWTIMEEV